jgi:hypothetical protein
LNGSKHFLNVVLQISSQTYFDDSIVSTQHFPNFKVLISSLYIVPQRLRAGIVEPGIRPLLGNGWVVADIHKKFDIHLKNRKDICMYILQVVHILVKNV